MTFLLVHSPDHVYSWSVSVFGSGLDSCSVSNELTGLSRYHHVGNIKALLLAGRPPSFAF